MPRKPEHSARKGAQDEVSCQVALTIDTNTFPPRVLLARGTAGIEVVDGVPRKYLQAAKKHVGAPQWTAFKAQARATYKQMARIAIVPE
jgi:hypothetical protein